MNSNVNLEAAVGVLTFLGTGLVLLVLGLIFIYTIVAGKFGRSKFVMLAALAVLGLYLGMTLVFSLSSRDKVLARGEEKYFCEIDCHLAYSVTDVRKTKTLGDTTGQAMAQGDFYVVTVKTRFDEHTISARRGVEAPLYPNPRRLTIFDGEGREYTVSTQGQQALRDKQGDGTTLDTPLKPGESYTTQLVFDLPPDARDTTLLINETDLPTRFIVGHENSLLHRRTRFRLDPSSVNEEAAGVKEEARGR